MIPALTAKTTALFVDDEDSLLKDLCDLLPKTHFFKTFNNPLSALEHLKFYQHPSFPHQESLLEDFQSTQFNDLISVMVVDHCMSPINGIELCQQLKMPSPKRIMLTAQATKDTAIKALNTAPLKITGQLFEISFENLYHDSTTIKRSS
jgi:CheY-like chemotaxis protein